MNSIMLTEYFSRLNYAIGALSAGGVYGAWRKSVVAGFVGAGILSNY